MGLEKFIKLIKEGEAVAPGTPNRPIQQLDQNINYVWDVIQAAELGSTVYARMKVIDSTLEVGQPVYFNASTQRFEAAYATTDTDPTTGYILVSPQSQVWGIIAEKHSSTSADILLFGYAKIDISAAVAASYLNADGSVPAGIWYLSSASQGQLQTQQPPISVPVLKTDANGYVFVNPTFVDFVENHRHYMFNLLMQPAGTVSPPTVGNTHSISAADITEEGWLPASDPIFDGNAPTGAKFGYNLSQNPELNNVFPPVPLTSAAIIMQRPSIWDTTNERKWYGQQLTDDLVVIDRNGIWWMSDCYDEVPWPTDLDSSSSASAAYSDCDPAGKDYSMKLYYARVGFATDNAVVNSLKSIDDRLIITCAGTTDVASTGDLEIAMNFSQTVGVSDQEGYIVFKTLDEETGVFDRGPVVEGIIATTENIVVSSTASRLDASGNTVHQGVISIGVLEEVATELSSQLVRLDGVTEEDYPVLYLGMPDDSLTSYVVKFEIPSTAPSSVQFQFRARIIGRAAGTLPTLAASYYVASRPTGGGAVNVTQTYTSLTGFDTAIALVSANDSVEVTSDALTLSAGDIVYIKVERDPDDGADTYVGELGVMQQVGVITSA